MRCVVLLCLLPLVLGGAILGQEKCVWGPSYWCSHVSHARECGATQHCLQTVWKNQIIKPESTKTCTYCELIVNEFRDVLADKVTEQKVAEILSNVCTILPSGDDRDLCVGVVTEYAPELLQMFLQDTTTDMICAAIDMCSGLEDRVSPFGVKATNEVKATTEVQAKNDSVCTDCMKFFKDVQDSVTSNETVNQLTELFNQTICSQLGSFGEACVDLVKQYLPIALQTLADQIDPDIVCRVFGFCTTEGGSTEIIKMKNIFQGRLSKEPLKYRSSEECDLCKDLFNQVVDLIKNKDDQDIVIAELKQVCDDLGSLADECKQLIDQYAPMLFELLVNELDPTTVCQAIGLCQTPSLPRVILAADVIPASMVGPGYVKNSVECTICKVVMQQLDDFLKANGTIEKVEDLIDDVCNKLASDSLKKQCIAFVAEYGPYIVKLTAQELAPKKICDAIGLCTNGTMKKPLKADVKCTLCEEFVNAIDVALKNISSEDLINDLKHGCSFIPGNYAATCLKYVNEYGTLVINLLKSEDPHSLCVLAQMCASSSSHTPYMTKPIPEEIPGVEVEAPPFKCEVCNTVVLVLKGILSQNATEAELRQALEKICDLVPSKYKSECTSFVKNYADDLIKLFVDHVLDIKTFCVEIDLCPALEKKPLPVSAVMVPYDTLPLFIPKENKKGDEVNGVECTACEEVMTYVFKELDGNTTEAAIEAELKKACSVFQKYEAECDELVKTYLKDLIDYIELAESPELICKQIGLCTTRTEKLPEPVHVKLLKDNSETNPVNADVTCVLCEFVMKELDNLLDENSTKAEIIAALDKVCSLLPTSFTQQCGEFVKQYAPAILKFLEDDLDPTQVCTAIGLCTAKTFKPLSTLVKILPPVEKETGPVNSVITCEICKEVIEEVDRILQNNLTEPAIKEALEKVCSLLPDTISTECQSLVSEYTDLIVKLIAQDLSPEVVCKFLKLCTSKTVKPFGTFVKILPEVGKETGPVNSVITCEICKEVIEEVDRILQDNLTEPAIKEALEKVCSLLPDTISTECQSLVSEYTDLIVKLIAQDLSPEVVCKFLKLCTSKTIKPFGTFVKILPEVGKGNTAECVACELLVEQIQEYLKKNRTEEELKKFLNDVCSYLPDTVTVQCNQFVDTKLDEILDMLKNTTVTPKQVCIAIEACTKPAVKYVDEDKKDDDTLYFRPHPKLVGQKKCTYGPAYWCASQENAKECNAIEHCMVHVWN